MRSVYYPEEKRTVCEWSKDGINHRTNTVLLGGVIPLHSHVGDHDSEVTKKSGAFWLTTIDPYGVKERRIVKAGWKEVIPAYWKHTFVPIPRTKNEVQIWEVDCSWPEGRKL